MKKILLVFASVVTVLFLVACNSKNELDGKYYKIYEGDPYALVFEIEGDKGYYYPDGEKVEMRIDKERNVFSYTGWGGIVFELKYTHDENGILSCEGSFGSETAYKEGSKAYNDELKKRDKKINEKELKEEKNKKQAETFSKSDELYEIVDYINTASVTDGSLQKTTKRPGEYVASYVDFDGVQYEIVSEYKVKSQLDNKDYSKYYRCYIGLKDGVIELSTLSDNSVSELITDSTYFENMIRVEDKLKD